MMAFRLKKTSGKSGGRPGRREVPYLLPPGGYVQQTLAKEFCPRADANILAVHNVFSFVRVRACREGGQNPLKRGVSALLRGREKTVYDTYFQSDVNSEPAPDSQRKIATMCIFLDKDGLVHQQWD
jgi:hypothetical protein